MARRFGWEQSKLGVEEAVWPQKAGRTGMLKAIGDFGAPEDAAQFEAIAVRVRANPAFPAEFLEMLVLGLGHRARSGMNPDPTPQAGHPGTILDVLVPVDNQPRRMRTQGECFHP